MSQLTYPQLLDAVNRVNGWRKGFKPNGLEKQLSASLRIYKARGEFDGTILSALECLDAAGYEVRDLQERHFRCQRHVNCQCKDPFHRECSCTPF